VNVLVVAAELPGASESFLVGHVPAIERAGHHVVVVAGARGVPGLYLLDGATRDAPVLGRRRAAAAVAALRAPRRATRFALRTARRSSSRSRAVAATLQYAPLAARVVDVVHHTSLSSAAAHRDLGPLLGVPTAVTVGGRDLDVLDAARAPQVRRLVAALEAADVVTVASTPHERRVGALTGTELRVVTPAALPTGGPAPTGDRPAGWPTVVIAGPLDYELGLEHVLVALARLVADGVRFTAEIAGDGPLRRYLHFTAGQLGLTDHLRWHGAMAPSELGALLAGADVHVTSGVAEEVTPPSLTAVLAGLATVTSTPDGATVTDLVDDGTTGYVVVSRDTAALADRLATLLTDGDRRTAMGRAGRARAEARFPAGGVALP
jgi:glycosyltransferase involved in cell wall biosynthesis